MKKSQLKQIIREEISYIFNEEDKSTPTDKKDNKCSSPEQKYIDRAKKALEANKEAWNKSSEEEKKKWIFQTAVMYCTSDSGGGDSISTDDLEADLGKVGDYDSFFDCDKDEIQRMYDKSNKSGQAKYVGSPREMLRKCQKRNKELEGWIGRPSQWSSLIYKMKGMLKLEENKTTMAKSQLKKIIKEEISKILKEDESRSESNEIVFNKLASIKRQTRDLNPNFTIQLDALKIRPLNLEITYNVNTGIYTIIDDRTGKEYFNKILYPSCRDCKFKREKDVIEFIRSKELKNEDSTGMVGSMYGENEYLRYKNQPYLDNNTRKPLKNTDHARHYVHSNVSSVNENRKNSK